MLPAKRRTGHLHEVVVPARHRQNDGFVCAQLRQAAPPEDAANAVCPVWREPTLEDASRRSIPCACPGRIPGLHEHSSPFGDPIKDSNPLRNRDRDRSESAGDHTLCGRHQNFAVFRSLSTVNVVPRYAGQQAMIDAYEDGTHAAVDRAQCWGR